MGEFTFPSDHQRIENLTVKLNIKTTCNYWHHSIAYALFPFSSPFFLLICIFLKVPINGKFPNFPHEKGVEGMGVCVFSVDSDKASWFCYVLACMLALVEHFMCDVLVHNILSSFLILEHAKWLIKPNSLFFYLLNFFSCIKSTFSLLAL